VYVNRVAVSPLAVKDAGGKPSLVAPSWPVMVQDSAGQNVASARFMVSVARREEKGSDVNVATHLLIDAFSSRIDAAVVITNDSDLALPIRHVRESVPVGLVNPTSRHCAGALSSSPREGAGHHWWYRLAREDLTAAQMPERVGKLHRPTGW
jgi:uncharacterized LabA/DUF88 family protein